MDKTNQHRGANFTIPPNPTVALEDRPRLAGQNLRLYEYLLMWGKISNREVIMKIGACNPSARISDVRAWLKKTGRNLKKTAGKHGLNWYRIVDIEGEKQ